MKFNLDMDMSPLVNSNYQIPWMLWIDWGESFNGNNTLTLSDITGLPSAGAPIYGAWQGSIERGITGSGGMIFAQPIATTTDTMHMTVSLTNNCLQGSVFGCEDGDLMIGIVPLGDFGSDETFLHFAVNRPLSIAVNNQLVGFDQATNEPLFLRPHTAPFAPTPEGSTFGLMLIGILAMWMWRRFAL